MKLRIVVIDSPYEGWEDPDAGSLFRLLLDLRFKGFRGEYGRGLLPVDSSDFIATHLMVCQERPGGGLVPLMAYKSVALERCREYRLPFPAVGIADAAGSLMHLEAYREMFARCDREAKRVIYNGGWTIDPAVRKDRALTNRLREMMLGIDYLFLGTPGTYELLSGGVMRFKVPEHLERFGYRALERDGRPLDPVLVRYLVDEPVRFMHLTRYNPSAIRIAESIRGLWEDRLRIEPTTAAPPLRLVSAA